jgi:diketogulonate reductase-like aldo/keto reductase
MAGPGPLLKLNNGIEMPALGLGVFLSPPEQTAAAVGAAIGDGYRLIDTAAAYGNEREVGQGIGSSGVERCEVFVTTKLWMSDYGYDSALRAFDTSLRKLDLDYLDLYLLQWPVPTAFDRTLDAWRALERLLAEGRVRAIGVSNFSADHLTRLTSRTEVVPAVNQIELHPFLTQQQVRRANDDLGIITQAWSPIGGVFDRNPAAAAESAGSPLTHPVITEIAGRYGKTPAQLILAWHLQHGFSPIPKSVRAQRIAENFDVFDVELTGAEIAAIDALDTGRRAGADPETVTATTFAITIDPA